MLSLALSALLHFPDVPSGYWAYPAITVMGSAGVLHGYTDGKFKPGLALTREQAAAILARVEALPPKVLPQLQDGSKVSASLRADVGAAYAAGVIEGTSPGVLDPQGVVTRAQAAAMIARAFKLPSPPSGLSAGFKDEAEIPQYALSDVVALWKAGVVQGDAAGDFSPSAPVTRAEYSAMLMRVIAFVGGAPGLRDVVAGSARAVYVPDSSSLAASSPIGGPAGAIQVGTQIMTLSSGAPVFRSAGSADIFAVAKGDPVALWLYPSGQVGFVADLAPASTTPDTGVVADVSSSVLYLDSGAEISALPVTVQYGGAALQLKDYPSFLLGSAVDVTGTASGPVTVDVTTPYVQDLSGTITAVSSTGFTMALQNPSTWAGLIPGLSAGDSVTVEVTSSTQMAGVGTNPPALPAVGEGAQVMGDYSGGAVAGSVVILSN